MAASIGASAPTKPQFYAKAPTLYPEKVSYQPIAPIIETKTEAPTAVVLPELTGTLGYAKPGGNCVMEPGVHNPGFGNPISWPVTATTPSLGATALFTFNHTGVVVGIWSNGDIEVRHQNYSGGQHRFPRSFFRGFR